MASPITLTAIILIFSIFIHRFIIHPLFISPLSRIPGPPLYALTKWRLALDDWLGTRSLTISNLHKRYGHAVRIGPSEVSFNSLESMRTIYGAGSFSERTSFYDMFDVYGTKNLFTFHEAKLHADRKRLLAHAYSKSTILRPRNLGVIRRKVKAYLEYLSRECEADGKDEIFGSLHYFAIDAITEFLYGSMGATNCLAKSPESEGDRQLLNDIVSVQRRRLSWFAVHFPTFTKWLYSQTGIIAMFAKMIYPMTPPTTYTGIRVHALSAWKKFLEFAKGCEGNGKSVDGPSVDETIVRQLYNHFDPTLSSQRSMTGLDIASECADHLLAGIDTTSDSLMFLIWAMSRPENAHVQKRLIAEIDSLVPDEIDQTDGIPRPEVVTDARRMPYLDLVIKESLRLYAPLPASEPRSFPTDMTIDKYMVPAETIVSLSPYALHRNEQVFEEPLKFIPERWEKEEMTEKSDTNISESGVEEDDKLSEMRKWFWAFSSGPRMCIGIHLAMAEMTTLIAAVYRNYRTELCNEMTIPGVGPAITSRFEVFHDVTLPKISDHECFIRFVPRKTGQELG